MDDFSGVYDFIVSNVDRSVRLRSNAKILNFLDLIIIKDKICSKKF